MPAWTPAPPSPPLTRTACKGALGEPGTLHQILKADAIKAALPKKATCDIDYSFAVFRGLNATHAHCKSPFLDCIRNLYQI